MNVLKPYNIPFVGLSTGSHEYSFELNDDFFDCFEQAETKNASLKGKLILHKQNNMLDLDFIISGHVTVNCDRCLEPFRYAIDVEKTLYIKFGDRNEEQSDEIIIIPATDSHIDVAQYFFEFVVLAIPARKVHEDGKIDHGQCDPAVTEKLKEYSFDNKDKKDKPTDERWDALKKLKFN